MAGDLEEGSALEMCYFLGKLQEPGMLLDPSDRAAAKAAKQRGEHATAPAHPLSSACWLNCSASRSIDMLLDLDCTEAIAPSQLMHVCMTVLAAAGEEDPLIRVPALKLSMVVQRLIDLERSRTAEARGAFAKLAEMAATGPVAAAAAAELLKGDQS